jgi:hypothetical protein
MDRRDRSEEEAHVKNICRATGLGILAALCLALPARPEVSAASGRRYLLLLWEDAGYEAADGPARAGRIAEYRKWSRETPGIESGAKLSGEAWSLTGGGEPKPLALPRTGFIAGLFVVRAAGDADAIRIAQTCLHLRYGGKIELRPIE